MSLILPTREKQKIKLVLPPRNFKIEKPKFEITTREKDNFPFPDYNESKRGEVLRADLNLNNPSDKDVDMDIKFHLISPTGKSIIIPQTKEKIISKSKQPYGLEAKIPNDAEIGDWQVYATVNGVEVSGSRKIHKVVEGNASNRYKNIFTPAEQKKQQRGLEAKDIMDSMIQSGQAQTSTPIVIPPREAEPKQGIIANYPQALKETLIKAGKGILNFRNKVIDALAPTPEEISYAEKHGGLTSLGQLLIKNKFSKSGYSYVDPIAVGSLKNVAKEGLDAVGKEILKNIKKTTPEIIEKTKVVIKENASKFIKSSLSESAKTGEREANILDELKIELKDFKSGKIDTPENIIKSEQGRILNQIKEINNSKHYQDYLKEKQILQPLAQEARKYKSAEEFVKGQTPIYKGGAGDISLGSFSTDINHAQGWADRTGGKVVEKYFAPNTKFAPFQEYHDKFAQLKTEKATDAYFKAQGYDGVDFRNSPTMKGATEKEVRIWNPDKLQTKSQLTDIWNEANKGVKQTLDDIFESDIKPKMKTLTGKEQLEIREAQKVARQDAKLRKESMIFGEETLEDQYQNFKKLVTPGKLSEIEDVVQLKNKVKAEPAAIDNILYSQTKNDNEIFDMFKDRRLSENFALPQVEKETKAIVAEKARQTIMSAKEKVERRRQFVKIAQRQFELSDNDVRKISQRDVRNMADYEFKKFIDDFRIKAMELAKTRQAKNQVLSLIRDKELQRVDALRRAMELPPIEKMSIDDLSKLETELEKTQVGDVFLTQRELETVPKTDLGNIKTVREAREKLAQELKIPIEKLENIKVSELDRLRFDTALAEKNPFYKMMVEETHANLLKAEEIYLGEEKIVNDLVVKARKSKPRGLAQRAIPTDDLVFDYLSGNTKLAEKMTKEELELANYLQIKYADALEYLIENKVLTKGRSNYITNTRRGFLEAIKDSGLKKAFTELLDSYKQDEQIFQILDQSTKEILPLEKFFKFSLQRTGGISPTKNIAKATETYFKILEKKKALDALIPKIDIYVQSLTPQKLTPKGLEMDRRLKTFVNEWLNTKKGRRTTLIAKQGGKIDIATGAIRSFLYFKDLALSLPIGLASLVGEQVSTFVNIGNKLYLKGVDRYASKQGRQIIETHKFFIGKNIWEELAEPSKNIGDKFTEGMFGLFKQSTVEANKIHLLGSLTDEEFKAGKVSAKRLAEMKLEIGKYRMLSEGKSIIGSTPEGQILTQYKTWAIPIFRSVSNNLLKISKDLASGDIKKTFTSKELKETLRAAEITTAVILLGNKFLDEEDDSYLGKLTKRLNMEALTILGALDTKTMLAAPRLVSFVENLGKAISSLIKLEEYKTKEGYIGVEQLKKELKPGFLRQFEQKEKPKSGRQKQLDKIFNRGIEKRQSLNEIFK